MKCTRGRGKFDCARGGRRSNSYQGGYKQARHVLAILSTSNSAPSHEAKSEGGAKSDPHPPGSRGHSPSRASSACDLPVNTHLALCSIMGMRPINTFSATRTSLPYVYLAAGANDKNRQKKTGKIEQMDKNTRNESKQASDQRGKGTSEM